MKKFLSFVFVFVLFYAQAQSPFLSAWLRNSTNIIGRYYVSGNSTPKSNGIAANVQSVKYSTNYVYVTTNGVPSYITGPFLDGNPSQATSQNAIFKFPLVPTKNTGTPTATTAGNIGIFINGVALFDYRDGVSWQNAGQKLCGGPIQPACTGDAVWNRDAVVAEKSGFDCSKGHPAMGNYHHHQNPSAFGLDLTVISTVCNLYTSDALYVINSSQHSPLLGFAYDGFPIYGAYGYKNVDGTGGIVRIKSSYSLRNITTRTTYSNGTTVTAGPAVSTTYPLGYFKEDYQYTAPTAAQPDYLDEHNGRFCVTPEFPTGTYAYFCTVDANHNSAYPYCVGPTFYGNKVVTKVTSISEPITTYTGPILSAETINFTGIVKENTINLNWKTTKETNVLNYVVEVSLNGKDFNAIASVQANNKSENDYAYTHTINFENEIYYRLKIVDATGKYKYSNTISFHNNLPKTEVGIYPNPVADVLIMQAKNILTEDVSIKLYNTMGQIVKQNTFYQGSTIAFVETKDLVNGSYFVNLSGKGLNKTYRVVVSH